MLKVERVLVPVDFSPFSEKALHQAVEIAEARRARITLLHVSEPLFAPDPVLGIAPPVPAAEWSLIIRRLRDIAQEWVGPAAEKFEYQCVSGAVAARIVEVAGEGPFDLIVMGTHGRTGVRRWVLGSVAEKVVSDAPCPVVTVCPESGKPVQLEGARGTG